MVQLTCSHCSYTWLCESKLIKVACPSCRRKVHNSAAVIPEKISNPNIIEQPEITLEPDGDL